MRYILEGLDCAHCAAKIEAALRKISGLEEVTVNFATKTVELPRGYESDAQRIISSLEPDVTLITKGREEVFSKSHTREIATIAISGLLLVLGVVFNKQLKATPFQLGEYVVLLSSFLLVGWRIVYRAIRNIMRGQVFDENFLMTIASLGAIAIGELPEAAAVMVFYTVGEFLQELAVNRSRKSIAALLNIRPEYANLSTPHGLRQVSPESVCVGQLIVVKPGERVPVDGTIMDGSSILDTSALTGEAVPRQATVGDGILAGVINLEGVLTVEVKKSYADSSVARILELVERASERKAPAERFITSFARVYTPVVVISAALIALLPPLLIPGALFSDWLYRALVLLVISCPCALVVSVPLTYFGGIGAASRYGVLFKGANYLDALSNMHTVVFDKTGTLTKGVFKVTHVRPTTKYTEATLLRIAGAVESHSNHPVARSITTAVGGKPLGLEVSEVRELSGKGLFAMVDGQRVLVGSLKLLEEYGVLVAPVDTFGTIVYIAVEEEYAGYIVVSDELKDEAQITVERLKALGASKIVMLTGDRKDAAERIATAIGLDDFIADLLPEHKVGEIESLKKLIPSAKGQLIFVGDGINDAPVIARSDIGVAMGSLGSDAAIEAADIVLMQDALGKLATAVEIARYTGVIVRQNVVLSLGVKAVFLLFGVLGITTIWGAVFADVGVAVLAVLNATRVLRYKEVGPTPLRVRLTPKTIV
ncbi:MAG: Cd2+/Zn2+-exporting ATPase [Bacillota bacterium]|nr:MAG: Cd2+/Zn2+-exporting ATPase [Bacillota bacterium]